MIHKLILDGNKLIAIYLGALYEEREVTISAAYPYTLIGVNFANYNVVPTKLCFPVPDEINLHTSWGSRTPDHKCGAFTSLGKLQFHKSWDWLMPVIQKIIKEIGIIPIMECSEEQRYYRDLIRNMNFDVCIDQAWSYVVSYLEWRNNNVL